MKKCLFLLPAILLIMLQIGYAQTPVAYYPFTGNANDAIGTLNGTVNGALLATDRFGTANSAYSFDGVDDFISTANIATNQTDNWTMTAWVKPSSISQSNGSIVLNGFDNGSTGNGYAMVMSGNLFQGLLAGVVFVNSGFTFNTNNIWYHTAMVREAGITKLYFNGVVSGTTSASTPNLPSGTLQIGSQNNIRFWSGSIDEVKIYNTALTAAQVQAEYASSNQIQKPGSGNAISFDGVDDFINTNGYSVPVSGDFAVEFWVNNHSNSGFREFISQGTSGDAFYVGLDNSGTGTMRCGDKWLVTNAILPLNKWTHVAITKQGTNATLYLNGIQAATTTGYSISSAGTNTLMGRQYGGITEFPNADIDEVRIWNIALSQAQIRDRMCHKITNSDALYSNLVAYYNFDESTGNTAFDGTVNANNGTLTNSPTRVTSGAAIGNTSAFNYVTTGLPAANLTTLGQDNLAVAYTAGTYTAEAGTHVYAVEEVPNTTNGNPGVGTNNRYFGVFNANLTSPVYTVTYNYNGNPFVANVNEPNLFLFKRNDNAATLWSNTTATLNTIAKTLTTTGQNTEYMLGVLPYTWAGTTNTLWNVNTNWVDATLPPTDADIRVPTSVSNMPELVAATSIKNLILETNTTLNLNNQSLAIGGNVTGTGTFTGSSTSSLIIGGAAGALNFTGSSQILKDLTLRPGASASLGTPLQITAGTTAGTVIDSLGAVLTTNGNLTLKSDDNGTARIGRSAGTIVGNVTVERNIANAGHRAWHLLAVPTTGAQTIFDAWQEGGAIVPNKGTWITCPTPTILPGFDGTSINGASILIHDQTIPSWTSIPVDNTNSTSLSSRPGYMLFVRGDRNYTPTLPTPTATNQTVLKSTGALRQGTQAAVTVSATGTGRTLVGNPFASAIDFDSIYNTPNLDPNFYIWDATLTGNFGVGGFRVVQRIGADNYQATPGLGTGPDNTLRYIHSGQAFLLKATSANANVVFGENAKVALTGVINPIANTTGDQQIITNLMIVNAGNSESLADGIRVRYDASYSANITDDIIKIGNFAENISSYRQNTKLIVEHRPMIQSTDTIFLRITNAGIKAYRLKINTADFVQLNSTAFLQDAYLNTSTPINLNGVVNNVDFSVTADAASANPDRFRIVFAQAGPLPVTFTSIKAYQTAGSRAQQNNIAVEWKVSNQLNIEKYEVEKSLDGSNFSKAATQTATGVNGSNAVYNWLDVNAVAGNAQHPADNFYRIRSIGIGGDIKYSSIVKVTVSKYNPAISVYPNPMVNGIFTVQFTDMPEGIYHLRLINTLGQVVMNRQLKHSGGSVTQTQLLDRNIAEGIYRMEFIKADNTVIEKVLMIIGK